MIDDAKILSPLSSVDGSNGAVLIAHAVSLALQGARNERIVRELKRLVAESFQEREEETYTFGPSTHTVQLSSRRDF